ncbi:CD276 antigen homolog [Periophthalmus magnuspinnatus]|uniref:CD276 antigen homolog n=1 Tax=Periophthalmus magnuspinnatus TaxID=409849 RepID=UPI0024365AD9|nr:CD276 antigen homolog [Periophthalmus magnuspinnatus]
MVSMNWVTCLTLPVAFLTLASGLFTVELDKSTYKSEVKGDVVMGCSFQTPPPTALSGITVRWHWIAPGGDVREVYHMDNAGEQLATQHPDYRGRARLLTDEIKQGWAKLQISNLRISDSGKYQCFVQTEAGADYKTLTLSVFAPFKSIDKRIVKVSERGDVGLICQSEGYPQPEVTWHNGDHFEMKPFTTTEITVDQLFRVTTQINVTTMDKNNYTCNFTNKSATIQIPDDIPLSTGKKTALIVTLCIALPLVGIILIFVVYKCQQKGNQNESIIDEEKTQMNQINSNGCLKTLLKHRYSKWIQTLPRDHMDVKKPYFPLYHIDGQQLNLNDLVPANGEALLLEGPEGSGKTTLIHRLVFSWTQLPVSDLTDLNHLLLVFYVDGSNTNSNLLDEIITQLSLKEVVTENDLKNVLTTGTLLIVDGYKEGNLLFDESLQRFLFDRGGCRVLITTSQKHSKVKEIVGTGATVTLQIQRQK